MKYSDRLTMGELFNFVHLSNELIHRCFSGKVLRVLENLNFKVMKDLTPITGLNLMRARNFGRVSLEEFFEVMEDLEFVFLESSPKEKSAHEEMFKDIFSRQKRLIDSLESKVRGLEESNSHCQKTIKNLIDSNEYLMGLSMKRLAEIEDTINEREF